MPFTLAIVGRPNVGKSTLFNRLVGKRLALVDDRPGVTRDRREGEGRLFDLSFRVVDTAGLEDVHDESLEARMRAQTERAVAGADVALLLLDARAGVTALDAYFANWLRRGATPVILVANKCEGRAGEAGLAEAYRLGLDDPIALSAEHALGLDALYDRLQPLVEASEEEVAAVAEGEGGPDRLQLAVVGRPNVGKSTLVNRLIGEERLLTGPEAGITRDAIAVDWTYKDRAIRLIDTAGLRKRARVQEKLEKLSAAETRRSIDFAHVVVLLVDAGQGLEKQDLTIARQVIEEGRCLVIAVNKWDACRDRQVVLRALRDRLTRSLPQIKGIPVVTLSALQGQGLERLLDAVTAAYDVWNRRLPTAPLNRWLAAVTGAHPPPAPQGRRIRLKYITQARSRPPTFALSCSNPKDLPESYLRYLENALRTDFDLPGTPIRIHLKRSANPYAER
jgi:GTP-binding protein